MFVSFMQNLCFDVRCQNLRRTGILYLPSERHRYVDHYVNIYCISALLLSVLLLRAACRSRRRSCARRAWPRFSRQSCAQGVSGLPIGTAAKRPIQVQALNSVTPRRPAAPQREDRGPKHQAGRKNDLATQAESEACSHWEVTNKQWARRIAGIKLKKLVSTC